MNAMKWLKWIVIVVVVLIIGGLVTVYLSLDSIIKHTVDKQGTASLNLQTNVQSASLALFGGKLGLNNLTIASPPGFNAPHMLELGSTDLQVSYGQLRQDPVHVKSITLDKPKLVVERQGGTINIKKAADLMPQLPPDGKPATKLIIDDLLVKDALVTIQPNIPGLPNEINVPVPNVELKNVGTGEGNQNGAEIKDVAMQLMTALAAKASDSDAIPPELKALLKGDLSQVLGSLGAEAQKRILAAVPGELGQTLGNLVSNPDALKNPQQAIGNLMKKENIPTSQPADLGKAAQGLGGLLKGKAK